MFSIQSVFRSAINHNLDGCFYSSIWNWDMVGGYMRRVWIPVFHCLALAQDTLKIQSCQELSCSSKLYPLIAVQPYTASLPTITSSSLPAGLGQWHCGQVLSLTPFSTVCRAQLYMGSHAPDSHLCAGSYTAPIFANSCVTAGVTAPLRIRGAGESSKAVKLQQHLLSVPEHGYRGFFL